MKKLLLLFIPFLFIACGNNNNVKETETVEDTEQKTQIIDSQTPDEQDDEEENLSEDCYVFDVSKISKNYNEKPSEMFDFRYETSNKFRFFFENVYFNTKKDCLVIEVDPRRTDNISHNLRINVPDTPIFDPEAFCYYSVENWKVTITYRPSLVEQGEIIYFSNSNDLKNPIRLADLKSWQSSVESVIKFINGSCDFIPHFEDITSKTKLCITSIKLERIKDTE